MLKMAMEKNSSVSKSIMQENKVAFDKMKEKDSFISSIENSKFPITSIDHSKIPGRLQARESHQAMEKQLEE